MQYPLELNFKIWTFAPSISVTDAQGNLVFFVRQKLFKFKEAITVHADQQRTQHLFDIKADRIIDFSARYNFSDSAGNYIGSVKRRGIRSLWRARYDIFDGEASILMIQEENPWVKVLDGLFQEIPFIGLLSGYVFHPKYLVSRTEGGNVVMHLEKKPSLIGRRFMIKQVDQLSDREEQQVLLSLLMMVLLERSRG